MPANFPEMWENRVRTLLQDEASAPWLEGIPELDTNVIEVGSGDASESNIIHIPTTTFKPEVLINNTTYPIALVAYTDDSMTVQLDKYQTKVTTLSDDQTIGASYKQIDVVTKGHRDSITESKYAKALHSLAPAADNSNETFVIEATGEADASGRKKLLWKDVVTARRRMDAQKCKKKGRRLVLCSDHTNDLLEDNSNKYADQLADYLSGKIKGMLAGFEIYEAVDSPVYDVTTKQKKAWGAIEDETNDRYGSVIFHPENIVKKTGMTKQYFSDSKTDPENQTNKLNYRHYYLALPVLPKYAGAII